MDFFADVILRSAFAPNPVLGGFPELLSLNQQTSTDTLGTTKGFFPTNVTYVTITSDDTHARSGSKSLKITLTAGTTTRGVFLNNYNEFITGIGQHTYKLDSYLLGDNDYFVTTIYEYSSSDVLQNTTTASQIYCDNSDWTNMPQTITITNPNTVKVKIGIGLYGTRATSFWIDDLSFKRTG